MASSTKAPSSPASVAQNRRTLLRVPKEVIMSIHFYASQPDERSGKHDVPSRLDETCRDLRWLRRYGRTQSLTLTSRDAPVPENMAIDSRFKRLMPCQELENFDPDRDPLSFRQELIYLNVFLDRNRPQDEQISWRAIPQLIAMPQSGQVTRTHGELANFNLRLCKLLKDAHNLRYFSFDIGYECEGFLFNYLFTHPQTHLTNWNGDLKASGGLQALLRNGQTEFWETWQPQCLEHLHIVADDIVTASILERCPEGVLKHLHMHQPLGSLSFKGAAWWHGPFITRLSLTLQHGKSSQSAPERLPALCAGVWGDIAEYFPNVEWVVLSHCKAPGGFHHGHNSVWPTSSLESLEETLDFDEDCKLLALELESMPKLRKIAIAMADCVPGPEIEISGFVIPHNFEEEDMLPNYTHCARNLLRGAPHVEVVSIISKRPYAYLFRRHPENEHTVIVDSGSSVDSQGESNSTADADDEEHSMADLDDDSVGNLFGSVKLPRLTRERIREDEPKNGFLGFPFTLCSEPWEQTYLRDDGGLRRGFRHLVKDREY